MWKYLILHCRDDGLPWLFAIGFIIMGSFVTLFNYIGYRLMEPPYHFSQAVVGMLSIVYLSGTYSASKAGALTRKYGYGRVLIGAVTLMLTGILITLGSSLAAVLIGMLVLTTGFFAAHSVTSSWVGRRARRARAQASSLYLFCYYGGSSIAGTLGGVFWSYWHWNGIGWFIAAMLATGVLIALYLNKHAHS